MLRPEVGFRGSYFLCACVLKPDSAQFSWWLSARLIMQVGGAKRRVFTTQSLPLSPGYENRFSLPAQSLPLPVPVNLEVPPRTRRSTSPFNLVRRSRCKVNHDQIPEEFMLSNSPLSILPSEQHRPGRVSSARSKFSQLKKKSRESASSFKGISLNHIFSPSFYLSISSLRFRFQLSY